MMYKIEIVELLENDTKYPTENRVYEQKIANLDIEKVALFLNTKHNFQALPKNLQKENCTITGFPCKENIGGECHHCERVLSLQG